MAKVGRPPKLPEPDIEELVSKLDEYISNTDIPIVAEFSYLNDIDRSYLYDRKEFSSLLKKLISKKEAALEKGTLNNSLNSAMAIFSLKQLGWRDKEAKIVFVDPKTLTDEELKKLVSDH